jgi:Uma2 family endonuclease
MNCPYQEIHSDIIEMLLKTNRSRGGCMSSTESVATETLSVKIRSADLHVTPAQFDRLCQDNRDLRLELTKEGKLIVMAPTFGESGERNGNLFGRVWAWNERTQLGTTFDSSTGYDFSVIGGGKLSPRWCFAQTIYPRGT